MFIDGLISINPIQPFKVLEYYRYDQFGVCTYHGQVNPKNNKPNGLGMAIFENGNVHEGVFRNGQKGLPYL